MKLNLGVVCGLAVAVNLAALVPALAQGYTLVGGPATCTSDHCACNKQYNLSCGAPGCWLAIQRRNVGTKTCCLPCSGTLRWHTVDYEETYCYLDCDGDRVYNYQACDWAATARSGGAPCT